VCHHPPPQTATIEEEAHHFLLLLFQLAGGHRNSVTHPPTVRPGGVVRHRVVDLLLLSEEQYALVSLRARFPLLFLVLLTRLTLHCPATCCWLRRAAALTASHGLFNAGDKQSRGAETVVMVKMKRLYRR
jgi:hypothetical protein